MASSLASAGLYQRLEACRHANYVCRHAQPRPGRSGGLCCVEGKKGIGMTVGKRRVARFSQTSESREFGGLAIAGSGRAGRHAAWTRNCPALSISGGPARESRPRGVGQLADLGPLESDAVRYLRLWCDGPASQCVVWNEFATRLGTVCGRAALNSFEHLVCMCVRRGRRSDAPRPVKCPCLSVHESLLAQLVGATARGDREGVSDAAGRMVGTGGTAAFADRSASLTAALQDMRCHTGPGTTGPRSLRPLIN